MAITTGANMPTVTEAGLEEARTKYVARQGRPTKYNDDLAAEIVARLETGETMSAICRTPGMPHRITVIDWCENLADFGNRIARARSRSGVALADAAQDVLDDLQDKAGLTLVQVRVGEVRSRVRLELAKAYDRDTYGDKRQIDSTLTVAHTIGGIIDAVMGKTTPLVVLEVEDTPLIDLAATDPVP